MPSTLGLRNVQTSGSNPQVDPAADVHVDGDGNVIIPAALASRLGLDPHEEVLLDASARGARIWSDSLRRVYVEATGVCNLACVDCVRNTWSGPGEHMPIGRFERLLAGLPERFGRLTLAFGGFGEPLTHPDFLEMVSLARERELRVEVITNGTLLAPELSARLLAAGVAQIAISLDGPDPVSYATVRGSPLEPVLTNLKVLAEAKRRVRSALRVGLAFVAMRRNIDSLPGLLALAQQLGVDFVSISNLVPHTREMEHEALWSRAAWQSGFRAQNWRPQVILGRIDNDQQARQALAAVWEGAAVVPPTLSLGDSSDAWRNCCRFVGEGTLAVAWDGQVAPCLSLLHSHVEYINGHRKQVRSYTVGHIDDQTLTAIWQEPEYRAFRRRVRAFGFPSCFVCGGCPNTESNEEDCYGNPFPVCGECLWAQGIVLCP